MTQFDLTKKRRLDRELEDARDGMNSLSLIYYSGWTGGALGALALVLGFILPIGFGFDGEYGVVLGLTASVVMLAAAGIVGMNQERYIKARKQYRAARHAIEDYNDTIG